jgi:hypothetical protein
MINHYLDNKESGSNLQNIPQTIEHIPIISKKIITVSGYTNTGDDEISNLPTSNDIIPIIPNNDNDFNLPITTSNIKL